MASGKDDKWEDFREIYETEIVEEELRLRSTLDVTKGDTVDEDSETECTPSLNSSKHFLRSGSSYPVKPPRRANTNQNITPTNPIATMPDNNSPSSIPASGNTQVPLKVLPTEASVRRYTGQEEGYTARAYLKACEDVMRHIGTTDPAEKISFVRARIAPNSKAERLLQSVGFSTNMTGDDYDKFTQNFLRIFGGGAGTSVIRQLDQVVGEVTSDSTSLEIWEGTIPINHQGESLIDTLKREKWIDSGIITEQNFTLFIQLFLYMLQVKGKVRDAALPLTIKPGDDLMEFVTKIETRMKERRDGATAVAVASIPLSSDPGTGYAAAAAKKPVVTCDYCHKVGHSNKKCLKKRKDDRNSTSTKDDWTHKPASGGTTPSARPKNPPRFSNVPEASGRVNLQRGYYCALHGHQATHDTDHCFSLRRMREDEERKRHAGTKTSGEAARQGGYNPG